jgi:DNA-directed RNA polymerase specialized sigma24 family protein
MQQILRCLPEDQREVIVLHYGLEGCTVTEISERLALPGTTVKGRILLGCQRLRELMAPEVCKR